MGCCSSNLNASFLPSKAQPGTEQKLVREMVSIREHYTMMKTLGTGGFGSVFLVKDKRTGVERVAKELIKTLVNEAVMPKIEQEFSLIKSLVKDIQEHPCILRLYEIIATSSRLYLISEYLHGGVLLERYTETQRANERTAAKYISDVVLALNCVHKAKIVHGNIKPSNLLFESDAPDSHIKIIDFGVTILQKKQNFYTDSVLYTAPEVLTGTFTAKSDIWSVGVILYTMLSGVLPYQAENYESTVKLIQNMHPIYNTSAWVNITPEATTLVKKMLSKNPKDRPTAEQILSDPWILSYNRSILKETPFDKNVQENLLKINVKTI
jgi:serine/threonine protein kinase